MKQVLKSDVILSAKTNVVSFKEFYVDDKKEKKQVFHFLTKNAKIASVFISASVDDLEELMFDEDTYFSILNKRIVSVDLSKAVGEFQNVASLENPFDLYDEMDSDEKGLISEFKVGLSDNLKKCMVVLSSEKGAVFVDKEFLEVYLEDGSAYELGLENLGKAEIISCVYDSRLGRVPSNIFVCKNELKVTEEVDGGLYGVTPEIEDEFESSEDGEDEIEAVFSSSVLKLKGFMLNNANEIEIDEDEDFNEWDEDEDEDEDSFVEFKPELKVKISFSKENHKVSFEVENDIGDERTAVVLEMNRALEHFSKINSSGVSGIVIGSNSYSEYFKLRDLVPDLGYIPYDDFVSIVSDCIAYNVIYSIASMGVEIALDFSKGVNHCVHDFALDEFINIDMKISRDTEEVFVNVFGTNNQGNYIGEHWSITNLMKQSLLTWIKK